MSGHCGILNISQPYGSSRSVTGIALQHNSQALLVSSLLVQRWGILIAVLGDGGLGKWNESFLILKKKMHASTLKMKMPFSSEMGATQPMALSLKTRTVTTIEPLWNIWEWGCSTDPMLTSELSCLQSLPKECGDFKHLHMGNCAERSCARIQTAVNGQQLWLRAQSDQYNAYREINAFFLADPAYIYIYWFVYRILLYYSEFIFANTLYTIFLDFYLICCLSLLHLY
jgi:hypothetical protein